MASQELIDRLTAAVAASETTVAALKAKNAELAAGVGEFTADQVQALEALAARLAALVP